MLQLRKVYLVTPFVCQTRQLSFSRAGVTLRKSTDNTQRWLSANRIIAQSQDGDDYRRNRYRHNNGFNKTFGTVVAFGLSGIALKSVFEDKENSSVPVSNILARLQLKGQTMEDKKSDEASRPASENSPKEILPDHIQYLLIGGGTASVSASRAIKSADPKAKILIIGEENRYPYMRPPLSKELWFGKEDRLVDGPEIKFDQWTGKDRSLFFEKNQFYTPIDQITTRQNGGISILPGHKVTKLDSDNQIATIDDGRQIKFEKCLVATGGYPKRLEQFNNVESKVSYFRNLDDLFKLVDIAKKAKSIVVVGGGFLGSELACALSSWPPNTDLKVTQIFPESGLLTKVLPSYLSKWATNKVVMNEGVNIVSNTTVISTRIDPQTDKLVISTSDGKEIIADHAIVAVGLDPETELGKASGMEIDEKLGGYKVNEELQSKGNIWVAGDTASFPDPLWGQRILQHHDNAVLTGKVAGENMTGSHKKMNQQSMFWSDLGADIAFEGVGLVNPELKTFGVFAQNFDSTMYKRDDDGNPLEKTDSAPGDDNYGRGVIFYLLDDVIVGVLLWNIFNHLPVAKKILREQKKFDDLSEVARLFPIYPQEIPSDDK